MKKIIAIIMAAALAFVLAACEQETETPQEPETEEIKTVEPDHKLRVIIITGVTELEDDELQPLLDRYSLRLLGASRLIPGSLW